MNWFSFFNLLAGPFIGAINNTVNGKNVFDIAGFTGFKPIAIFLDNMIIPATIIIAILGAGWVIWLGVKLAKAEDSGKATEARKALIRVAVAIISTLVIIWVLVFVATNIASWVTANPIGS